MNNLTPKKNHTKLILQLLAGMVVFLAIVVYFGFIKPQKAVAVSGQAETIQINGVVLPEATQVAAFSLEDTNGNVFSEKSLQGHWTMVFFGFTNCGMVCPTTMAALNQMYKTLEKELPNQDLPQVVMVTVDPDRDTIKKMRDYVQTFNKNFIGARADIAKTIELEKQLHIAAAKIEADGQGKNHYTINHTADILLFNPEGRLQAYLAFPHKSEQMVKDYKLILNRKV